MNSLQTLITNEPELAERWINACIMARRFGTLEKFIDNAVSAEFDSVVGQQMFDYVMNMDAAIHSINLERK